LSQKNFLLHLNNVFTLPRESKLYIFVTSVILASLVI